MFLLCFTGSLQKFIFKQLMSSVIFTATGNGTGGMIKLLQWHSCTLSPGAYSLLMNSSASPCVYHVNLNFALQVQVVIGKVQYGTPLHYSRKELEDPVPQFPLFCLRMRTEIILYLKKERKKDMVMVFRQKCRTRGDGRRETQSGYPKQI